MYFACRKVTVTKYRTSAPFKNKNVNGSIIPYTNNQLYRKRNSSFPIRYLSRPSIGIIVDQYSDLRAIVQRIQERLPHGKLLTAAQDTKKKQKQEGLK